MSTTPPNPAPPAPPGNPAAPLPEHQFDKFRQDFKTLFQWTFVVTLIVIAFFVGSMLIVVYRTTTAIQDDASASKGKPTEFTQQVDKDGNPQIKVNDPARIHTHEAVALLTILQIGLCMFLGFTAMFYGLLMTGLGITASYESSIRAAGRSKGFGMTTGSPSFDSA